MLPPLGDYIGYFFPARFIIYKSIIIIKLV